jgi:ATP-dependent metalloprotease
MEKVIKGEKLPDKIKSSVDAPIKLPSVPLPPPFGVPPPIGGQPAGEEAGAPEAGDESRPYPAA